MTAVSDQPRRRDSADAPSEDGAGESSPAGDGKGAKRAKKAKRRRSRWRTFLILLVGLIIVLAGVRLALSPIIERYVNHTLDQHPMYDGRIGDVDLYLLRGAYAINDVRIVKTTGNVPVPLFAAERVDLAVEWDRLLVGKIVGRIAIQSPQLNFVDGETEGEDQTGAGGPWLDIIQDLFPFRINTATIHNGSIHFRAFASDPPVDMYLSDVEARIDNLGNIDDDVTPLIATVSAEATALDHARFEYEMKFDPSSYRPTFQLATRLVGLDVTKTNPMARAYGDFDFEGGWFDLVIELDAKEGRVEGYVKPLFRNLRVFSPVRDVREGDPINVFWEALVGVVSEVLENQRRDQFGTVIELDGDLSDPRTNLLEIIGNVLHNAFVRAYLPKLDGTAAGDIDWLRFSNGSITEPTPVGDGGG